MATKVMTDDLLALVHAGLSAEQIRVQTGHAPMTIRKAIGGIKNAQRYHVYTRQSLATLFSVDKMVCGRWLRLGWIQAQRSSTGESMAGRHWHATRQSVIQFLSFREAWPDYEPGRMTDLSLRAIALQMRVRAGGDYVPLTSLTTHLYQCNDTLRTRARDRGVALVRSNNAYYVWSGDVEKLK